MPCLPWEGNPGMQEGGVEMRLDLQQQARPQDIKGRVPTMCSKLDTSLSKTFTVDKNRALDHLPTAPSLAPSLSLEK